MIFLFGFGSVMKKFELVLLYVVELELMRLVFVKGI